MFNLRRARTRKVSARSLIAFAGVAAATFGLAQVTGTMANPTDAVDISGSQFATGNFFPTPLPASFTCKTVEATLVWEGRAELRWASVPEATGYYIEVRSEQGEYLDSYTLGKGATSQKIPASGPRWAFLFVENGPARSTGYEAAGINRAGISGRSSCSNNFDSKANPEWEDTYEWNPDTVAPQANRSGPFQGNAMRITPDMAITESDGVTTTESPSADVPTTTPEAPTSTPPATTSPETTPPSTTETTPPVTTTPTEDPKPVLTDTLEGDGVTAGWLPGGNKVAVVDADGNELASGRVEKGSELHWHNGQLWVVGDTKVYRIMISPQDGTWKFYNDSGQNMPDFG